MDYKSAGANVASMLGGAAVGGTLMYLFDPKEGAERREYVAETACDLTGKAVHGTKEALSSVASTVRDKASQLGRATKAGTKAFASTIRERASDISEGSSRLAAKAAAASEDISDRFRRMIRGRRNTPAEKLGFNTGLKQSLGAVGLICVGVGAMYFLDPTAGHQRRRFVREKFLSGFSYIARGIDRQSRSLLNRVRRKSYSTQSDRELFDSVREDVGRCVSKPSLVSVECHSGRVILSGPILKSEADGLLRTVWSTPGVKEVINRLDPHENLHGAPGEQVSEEAPYSEANRI